MKTILFLQLAFMVGTMVRAYVQVVFYVLASIAIISHFHAHPDPVVSTNYDPIFILNKKKMIN